MGYVHSDKAVRDAGNAAEERLQKWGVELIFRSDLYEAVKRFASTSEAEALRASSADISSFCCAICAGPGTNSMNRLAPRSNG